MPSSAELQQHAIEIWQAGVAAVHGQRLVEKAIRCDGDRIEIAGQVIDRSQFDRILIVGGGKFSHYMAKGVETCLLYTSPSPRDQRGSRMPSSA